jgi:hypothetical protein
MANGNRAAPTYGFFTFCRDFCLRDSNFPHFLVAFFKYLMPILSGRLSLLNWEGMDYVAKCLLGLGQIITMLVGQNAVKLFFFYVSFLGNLAGNGRCKME